MKILANYTYSNIQTKLNTHPQDKYSFSSVLVSDTFVKSTQPSFKNTNAGIKEISANLIKNYKATKKINLKEIEKVANKISDYVGVYSSNSRDRITEFLNEFKDYKVLLKEIYKSKIFNSDGQECGTFLMDMQCGADTWHRFRDLFAPFKDDDESLREILFQEVNLDHFGYNKGLLINQLDDDELQEIVPNIKSTSLAEDVAEAMGTDSIPFFMDTASSIEFLQKAYKNQPDKLKDLYKPKYSNTVFWFDYHDLMRNPNEPPYELSPYAIESTAKYFTQQPDILENVLKSVDTSGLDFQDIPFIEKCLEYLKYLPAEKAKKIGERYATKVSHTYTYDFKGQPETVEKAVKIAAKYLPKKSNVKTTKDEFVTDYLNDLLKALGTSSPSAKLDEYINILHKYFTPEELAIGYSRVIYPNAADFYQITGGSINRAMEIYNSISKAKNINKFKTEVKDASNISGLKALAYIIPFYKEFNDAIKHNKSDVQIIENSFGKIMFNQQKTLDTILSIKSRDPQIYNKPIDNYGSPFIHAFAEVLPNEQNQKDYQKALQILKNTPKIDYNLRDAMGTSFLEKILNSENEQLLDVVKDFEFTYTPEIDYVYRNISTPEFKELVDKNVKVKFIDLEESIKFENKEAFDKTISCLKSPFAKPIKVLDDLMPIITEIKDSDFRYYVLSKFFEITSSNNKI